MENSKNNQLNVTPLKNYNAPNLPTLENAREKPALLKNLPRRWQKKAAMAACAGIIGIVGFFATSTVSYANQPAVFVQLEAAELNISQRAHGGGSPPLPFYVVHFTEQDAWGYILEKLEAAGFNFNAAPPEATVDVQPFGHQEWFINVGLDMFDAEKQVAISYINEVLSTSPARVATLAAKAFSEQVNFPVGVFYNPENRVVGEGRGLIINEITDEEKEEARTALIKNLNAQTQDFIDSLHADENQIRVTLNGTLLEFDVAPIIINGRTLVPVRTIFEALGMEVEWRDDWILSEGGEKSVVFHIGRNIMYIYVGDDERTIELDVPPQIINGRTLVPLRAIAEATGAIVEWDAATQTVKITS
ncbi:MAG: copper amine oxidase N-terminal domain-containing protein [Defluviitaleaceae bacterium]|nr:copper amine oxidase N-terminal domain-containing protein [Defluviitaleaceae bacterium]